MNDHEHKFPNPSGSKRSIGTIEQAQCNNCLAIEFHYTWDVKIDGEWKVLHHNLILPDPSRKEATS